MKITVKLYFQVQQKFTSTPCPPSFACVAFGVALNLRQIEL
jgi:hypothetical protein